MPDDTETTHTPGPWDFSPQIGDPSSCYQAQVWGPDGDSLAVVESTAPRYNADANARLIAAAPELLQAAKKMMRFIHSRDPAEPGAQAPTGDAVDDLRDAIDKAAGETQPND